MSAWWDSGYDKVVFNQSLLPKCNRLCQVVRNVTDMGEGYYWNSKSTRNLEKKKDIKDKFFLFTLEYMVVI